jgi:O-antigen ligase
MSDTTFTSLLVIGGAWVNEGRQSKTSRAPGRVLRLLDRFVFGSLLAVTVLVAIPYGTVEPWWISLYECAIFLLAALWVVEGFFTGSWDVADGHLLAPIAALAIFAYVQTVVWPWGSATAGPFGAASTISSDPFETRLTFLKFLAFAFNGALLLRYSSTRRRLSALIHVVIGVAVASALFGIARQAVQHNETGFILPYLRSDSGFGQFVNKNHFALLMEMAIGLATGLMFAGGVRRERLLFYISAVVLMWTGLVMTSSRGGLLSMFTQIVFMFAILIWCRVPGHAGFERAAATVLSRTSQAACSARQARWKRAVTGVVLGVCLLAVVAVSAVWVGGDLLVTRLGSLPGEIQSAAQEPHAGVRRREVWGATWNLIKAHPLAGSGFGAYAVAITRFHDASGKWTPEAAHNDYLELLASGGFAGTGLVAWLGVVFIKRVRRRLFSPDVFSRAACLGALTGIIGVLVHNVVDFGLHVTANAVVLIALVVIATKHFYTHTKPVLNCALESVPD